MDAFHDNLRSALAKHRLAEHTLRVGTGSRWDTWERGSEQGSERRSEG